MSWDYDYAYIRGSEKEEEPGRVELTSTDRQKDRQRPCGREQKRLLWMNWGHGRTDRRQRQSYRRVQATQDPIHASQKGTDNK